MENKDDMDFVGSETAKAIENFAFSEERIDGDLIRAMAMVKLACARVNRKLGYLEPRIGDALESACQEMISGKAQELIKCDPYQGGAGTSLNMNMNEALAWLAERKFVSEDQAHADTLKVDPLGDVNLNQSTNDTFPSAVKVAILFKLKHLEAAIAVLQEALQAKEREFAEIIKPGRTELQDAVPMTLGMEFGAYAEAISRDRWRIFKSRERIKTLNLGGTAIGTGLGAPSDYIFGVTEELKRISGLSISRAENLVDQTQNLDSLVEVSAMTKALAVNLLKIANDLKLLSSGPDTGLNEIDLPELQKGSSIMPGKVNPVMPEAVCQIALKAINDDNLIALASAHGQLELNAYLPLIAHTMLGSLQRLTNACRLFADKCVSGITANRVNCRDGVLRSQALATFLLPVLGYAKVEELVKCSAAEGISLREMVIRNGLMDQAQFDSLMEPKRMYKLGYSPEDYQGGGK
ncbi:MAG TPA: aspartate ammonia-lyase [Candidatus Cloacimonadota bacterium]|nr:aspartate ammonia-lyase [Candidatus Cloacimonadota bacterium]